MTKIKNEYSNLVVKSVLITFAIKTISFWASFKNKKLLCFKQ